MPETALIAMSGGVDSSVAAFIALRDGYDCDGAIMKLSDSAEDSVGDASKIAEKLGIDFHVFDFSQEFIEQVVQPFVGDYTSGRTPNPCIMCNKSLKFGFLQKAARNIGKDYVVTGHYVQSEYDSTSGRYMLKKSADVSKDQSYVLYTLSQEQLAHSRFPLGGFSKSQVREIAREQGFINADKRESQDICFVPDGDYAGFIEKHTGIKPRDGFFVDPSGAKLGRHRGIINYTVGQRRGLGLAMPYPVYVLEIRPEDDTVVVGKDELLYSKTLTAEKINLIALDKLDKPYRALVKIRYKHAEKPATVFQIGPDTLKIEFDEPQRAITKGQAAVIYDGDIVIGGGTIV